MEPHRFVIEKLSASLGKGGGGVGAQTQICQVSGPALNLMSYQDSFEHLTFQDK